MLRQLLLRTVAITDLTLILPSTPPHFLRDVRLPNITLLCTNISHHDVEDFLCRHPNIRHLSLVGSCGGCRPCPLTNVHLPSLTDLTCPPSCVALLRAPQVALVKATYHRDHSHGMGLPIFQLLRGTIFGSTSLTALHLDFDPMDRGLLRCIAHAVPGLTALKLTERCLTSTVSHLYTILASCCLN